MVINKFKILLFKLKQYGASQFLQFVLIECKLFLFNRLIKNSYSRNGEDIVIDKILRRKRPGSYIDIGAYDPLRFNNTYRFYKKGWRGIKMSQQTTRYKRLNNTCNTLV